MRIYDKTSITIVKIGKSKIVLSAYLDCYSYYLYILYGQHHPCLLYVKFEWSERMSKVHGDTLGEKAKERLGTLINGKREGG